ncbi:MAG: WG repeat-containing protein, partial [Cytophagales bacterium]|nr:WG repeat-containing protein [Cytophagales bacterium]
MHLVPLALLLGVMPLLLQAQPQPAGPEPAPAWTRQYDAYSRSEDVYIVSKGDKKGVVSLAGKPITKLAYDTILSFREGMAIVGMLQRGRFKTRGKYGYLNKQGTLVVPMEHIGLDSYSEGMAIITGGWCYYHYIDKKGNILFSLYANTAHPFRGGMSRIDIIPDSAGVLITDMEGFEGWKRNYVDHQGNLLIPHKYDSIGEYVHYGIRAIKRHGRYGFLDTTGREVLPPAFDDIDYDSSYFWGNRRRVGQGSKFGFVDTYTGRLVVPVRYEGSLPSRDSLCWLKLNGKWGAVSFSGTTHIPFGYDQVSS